MGDWTYTLFSGEERFGAVFHSGSIGQIGNAAFSRKGMKTAAENHSFVETTWTKVTTAGGQF